MKTFDVQVDDSGSITMIRPLSLKANRWLARNTDTQSWQWMCGTLCIDSRYAASIIRGMKRSRLKVDQSR